MEAPVEPGEIVVVAQRREERLRDVPASVAAIGAAQLLATTSQRVQDVANYVPNVAISANSGLDTTLTIRGVGSSSRNIGFDSRAGLYIDGVYLGQSPALDQDLLGLARIEVLRGPQGTLFGKNNVAGAINLITERPGTTLGGEAFARIGNLGLRQFAARVHGPLTDTIAASLSASDISSSGYVRNLPDDVVFPNRNSTTLRGQVNVDSGGPFTLYFSADGTFARERPNFGDALTDAFGSAPDMDAPGVNETAYTPGRITDDKRDIWGVSGEAAYAFDSGHVLKSITSYRSTDFRTTFDADRVRADLLYVDYTDSYRQFSEELQLISPGGSPLRYLFGVFLYGQNADTQRDALGGAQGALLGLAQGRGVTTNGSVQTRNIAGFGNIAYDVLPQLEVSVGGRVSWEKKSVDWSINGTAAPAFNMATGSIDTDRVDRDFSPSATITYRVTPTVNVYARYSSGYKSGGYNLDFISADVFPDGIEFQKETVDNYEAGVKGSFFDGRSTLNLTAFLANFSNYQVNQYRDLGGGRTVITISNAGAVRSKGIEAEATLRLAPGLNLQGSFGVLDTRFTDFPDGGLNGANLAGKYLPDASKFQGTIGANFRREIVDGITLSGSAQYSYRSGYFSEVNNLSTQTAGATTIRWGRVEGFGLLDTRIGIGGRSGWEVTLWARNLANRDYVNAYTRDFLGVLIETRGQPRTWGVEARFQF